MVIFDIEIYNTTEHHYVCSSRGKTFAEAASNIAVGLLNAEHDENKDVVINTFAENNFQNSFRDKKQIYKLLKEVFKNG